MADQDRTFDPSPAQANRGREPGARQRERKTRVAELAGSAPALEGVSDNPEEDWGEPIEGAAYSANHAMRGQKSDAERGPGPKTRAATKAQISRRL